MKASGDLSRRLVLEYLSSFGHKFVFQFAEKKKN